MITIKLNYSKIKLVYLIDIKIKLASYKFIIKL